MQLALHASPERVDELMFAFLVLYLYAVLLNSVIITSQVIGAQAGMLPA